MFFHNRNPLTAEASGQFLLEPKIYFWAIEGLQKNSRIRTKSFDDVWKTA
jgi:hypothetical protein